MIRDFLAGTAEVNRRQFMERAAKTCLGVTAFPFLQQTVFGAPAAAASRTGKAKNVIYLFLSGALSHIDSFDLKPGREVQGETKGIATKLPGMQFGELLPHLATQADKLAVINSLYTETGDHEGARYLMRTSYKQISTIRHPHLGSMAMHMQGRRNERLPDNVVINGEARHPANGYLDPATSPLPVGDPNKGLENTEAPEYMDDKSFRRRMQLINRFDRSFQRKYQQTQVEAYNEFYREAQTLVSSDDLKIFDLNEEKDELRDSYGRDRFGQGCLLARRLVEKNVRFVEVTFGGWDMHTDIYERLPERLSTVDTAVSALLKDLESKGLLEETMVVLTTEFGRSPKINQNAGRDHHPAVFSSLLAGAGVKTGQVYGASDEEGKYPEEDPVSVEDFNATIAMAMGLDLTKEIVAPNGRPFRVAHDGAPIVDLLG